MDDGERPQALVRSIDEAIDTLDAHLSRRATTPTTKLTPWRRRLADILEHHWTHFASLVLLLLDLALTIVDLSKTLLNCSDKGHHHDHHSPYHWASIGILGLLTAKSAALALVYGWEFFRQVGHVVDAVVIGAALVLEAVVQSGKGEAAGLVVVASLWRVAKLVDGACEFRGEVVEAELGEVRELLGILRGKLGESNNCGNSREEQVSLTVGGHDSDGVELGVVNKD